MFTTKISFPACWKDYVYDIDQLLGVFGKFMFTTKISFSACLDRLCLRHEGMKIMANDIDQLLGMLGQITFTT